MHNTHSAQTSEREMLRKEHHNAESAAITAASDEVLYKIDIPANRYDMLCLEGIARALNVFLGRVPPPSYTVVPPQGIDTVTMFAKQRQHIHQAPCTASPCSQKRCSCVPLSSLPSSAA